MLCMRAGVDLHLAPALCILRGAVALALVCVRPFSLAPAFLSRTGASLSLSFSSSLVLFHHKKRVSHAGGAVWQHSGAFPMHTLIVDTLQADLLFCTFLNVRRRP
jgi:hypothetical protein